MRRIRQRGEGLGPSPSAPTQSALDKQGGVLGCRVAKDWSWFATKETAQVVEFVVARTLEKNPSGDFSSWKRLRLAALAGTLSSTQESWVGSRVIWKLLSDCLAR
jgi:hypothetical protein